MIINLPNDVNNIIHTLTENGYEAYAVGGCVRDSIIRRVPGDWDITTSARPQDVKALFRRTIDTGIEHGTVTIMFGSNGYEVTTYRIDGEYEDSRHPKSVEFTASLEEDLKRRDFTINAMAYNDERGLVDLYGGQQDIENRIIRCVGDACERFNEDALRMLRAVRFSAQLGYDIAEDTCSAIKRLAPDIARISKERIHTELNKMLLSDHPDYIDKACQLGITGIVFPVYDEADNRRQLLAFLKNVKCSIAFRYAALMCDRGKARTAAMLRELKLDNATIKLASALVENHGIELTDNPVKLRHMASDMTPALLDDVLDYEQAWYTTINDTNSLQQLNREKEALRAIKERGDCLGMKELALKGSDLIALGIKPGKDMGAILNLLLNMVLDEPQLNTAQQLAQIVKEQSNI